MALVFVAAAVSSSPVSAQVTAEQRREITVIENLVGQAGRLYLQKKYKESGESIANAQERLEKLLPGANADVLKRLEDAYSRLQKAHALLELEGVELPALKALAAGSSPAATTPSTTPSTTPTTPTTPSAPPTENIQFAEHVAPILIAKCGNCHVRQQRGMFSMANFAALMRGPPAGKVVFAGDDKGSRLIEVIEEGDMPRGGGRVTPVELTTLKKWIAEGAKFEGDANAALASIAPASATADMPRLEVKAATGKETVSFSNDVAPLLIANCFGCHLDGQRASGNLNMNNFTAMLRGGDSGAPLAPGKAAESLIVQKLKGTASGERMPAGGRPALADADIAKIEKWIAEGATFDGPDPAQNIRQVAALAKARRSTHAEMAAERAKQSAEYWKLGMPGIDGDRAETDNFLLFGNVGADKLADYAKRADALLPKLAGQLHFASDQPLVKGRVTLYFFPQRYDYSEFGMMVEKRELPSAWRGHWRYNVIDAYGAMIPPRGDEYSADVLLAQQIAGAYVASLGVKTPRWFAEGAARAAAAKIDDKDLRVVEWNENVSSVAGTQSKPDDFLTGKLPAENTDILSYSFVKFLMTDAGRFRKLMDGLRDGKEFEPTFSAAYGGSPTDAAAIWAKNGIAAAPRRKP
jgi:hypothetical protein